VEITGAWGGLVAGIKWVPGGSSSSKYTLVDKRPKDSEPDEKVFEGKFKYIGVTAAAGKGWSATLFIQIGEARSWFDGGPPEGWKTSH